MLVYNPFRHDSRVEKEAQTFVRAGDDVTVVAVLDSHGPRREWRAGVNVIRVDSDPLPTKVARRLIAWRRRSRRAGGTVGGEELAPIGGVVSPTTASGGGGIAGTLLRAALRLHLEAAWMTYCARAYREAARLPVDLTVAHDLNTLPVGALLRRSGGRLVYDSHELFVETEMLRRSGVRRALWGAMERRLIRRADRVVTVSGSIASELAARYGVPTPTVVLNVPPRVETPPTSVDLAGLLQVPPEHGIALYVGGLVPGRGLEELVRASGLLQRATLVLLGPGQPSYRERLQRLATDPQALRLSPAVPADDLPRWVAAADVGVVPYPDTSLNHRYALPTKLFEYLAAGVPVVASDLPEIRRVVEGHGVGVTFGGDSAERMAEAINGALGDTHRLQQLGANARRAHDELNWEREGARLLRLVTELDHELPSTGSPRTSGLAGGHGAHDRSPR